MNDKVTHPEQPGGWEDRFEEIKRITVKIYGEEYVLKGQAEPADIEKIANYVDRKMQLVGQRNPQLPLSKVAVLAALNIAEDYARLHEDYENLALQLDEIKKLGSE